MVVVDWKIDFLEALHPFDPEQVSDCNRDVVFHQQHVDTVLHAGGIANQPLSMPEQFFELSSFEVTHMHRRDQVRPEQLRQHMRVDLVVFDFGRSDRLGL